MLDVLSAVSNYFGQGTPTKVTEDQVGDNSVCCLAESNFPISCWNALLQPPSHKHLFQVQVALPLGVWRLLVVLHIRCN